jgi:transglutaminase-like putative cysteine protease
VSARPLNERQRLRGRAWIHHTIRERLGASPNDALSLPDGAYPRTRAWAQGRIGQVLVDAPPGTPIDRSGAPATPPARSPRGLAADGYAVAVLAHIRNGGYDYTLAPGPVPPGVDALDDFWLDRKQGFCEHYAVALVVVLRSLGVPARIVTGYQGGHINAIDGVLEVRQSDAHAWAEYWRDGEWIRIDPTAAVAPERVRRNLRLRPPPGLMVDTLGRIDPGLVAQLAQLRQLWSAADHRWNQWVLDHGRQRQLELLRQLGWQDVDTYALARTLLIGLATLGLAGAIWAAWDGRRSVARPRRDAWLAGWGRLKQALTRAGITLPAQATPRSAAQAATQRWGTQAEGLVQALDTLERLRYAPPPQASAAADRRQLASTLRQATTHLRRLGRATRRP